MPWMRSGILQPRCCSGCEFCFLVPAHVVAKSATVRASVGRPPCAPLLLLSQRKPLRWVSVGFPLFRQKWGKERPKGPCPLVNPSTFVTPYAVERPHASAFSAHFSPKSGCPDVVPPTILTGCYFPAPRWNSVCLFVSLAISLRQKRFT